MFLLKSLQMLIQVWAYLPMKPKIHGLAKRIDCEDHSQSLNVSLRVETPTLMHILQIQNANIMLLFWQNPLPFPDSFHNFALSKQFH